MSDTRWCMADDYFPAPLIAKAAAEWPGPDWPHWLRYDTPLERKRACNDWRAIPAACSELLQRLLCLQPKQFLPGILASSDVGLYGAGMHDMGNGDHLDVHLDADRHPLTGMERRVNAILFLSAWERPWGGALELWADDMHTCQVRVWPAAGRLVVFETSDASYHGVEPIRCPPHIRRRSLAVYWWGVPRSPSKRPRALFVPRPGEPDDPLKVALRAERARPRECQATVTAASPAAG